ncbi:MAG: hypothetical protein PHP59_09035 [Methanofollis sp.]|uniref:hypothetical protein n=1 Tax=Methanofollis sp. TaxID=2052835 RepID=UPI002622B7A2|nr:hypothetical protein [Methanofollis sp.]MDD4255503.1 hypothetical protein [Methanofollis sp.]
MTNPVQLRMILIPMILLGILCLIIPASAAPAVMNVTLDKTYQYKDMSVRYLEFVDVSDPAVSKAWMLETIPGDLKKIETPSIRYLNRSFTSDQATVRGITVQVDRAALEQPLSLDGMAPSYVYTLLHVPTPQIEVAGELGNPIIAKYGNFTQSNVPDGISALFNASEFFYLYAPEAVVHYNSSTGQMTQVGTFSGSINSIGKTLVDNQVSLSPFSANANNTASMTTNAPECVPTPGKYALSAIRYDPAGEKIHVLASLPVVIMEENRSLTWNEKTVPVGFYPGEASDVTLSFDNQTGITDTAYLIVRNGTTYDIAASADVDTLAADVKDHWDTMGPTTSICDLLIWGVTHEIGKDQPVVYTVTAVGDVTPLPNINWSDVAITPGYGCSGHANSSAATIPAATLNTLGTGTYYVYAAGLNADHDIVAIDQKEVAVSTKPAPP